MSRREAFFSSNVEPSFKFWSGELSHDHLKSAVTAQRANMFSVVLTQSSKGSCLGSSVEVVGQTRGQVHPVGKIDRVRVPVAEFKQWPQGDQRLHGQCRIGAMLRLFRQVGM